MKHLVIGQRQKAPNFSAFHWSPHGSLVSSGQHFVTTNINTEIEIEADLNTESDQAMRDVHSCNSWLHGPSMFAVKAKIYGVLYNQASSIAFDETSSYWSALKSS